MPPALVRQGGQAQPEQPLRAGQQGQQKVGIFFSPAWQVAPRGFGNRNVSSHCPSVDGGQPAPVPGPSGPVTRHGSVPGPDCTPRPAGARTPGDGRSAVGCSGRSLGIKQCQRNPGLYLTFYSGEWDRSGTVGAGPGRRFPMVGGGRTKARCSCFVPLPSSIPPAA